VGDGKSKASSVALRRYFLRQARRVSLVDWEDKTIAVRFKPKFGFKPKDYEERSIVVIHLLGDRALADAETSA